jgi:outer membrane protein
MSSRSFAAKILRSRSLLVALLIAPLSCALFCASAQADLAGLHAGYARWDQGYSGLLRSQGASASDIDLDRDLALADRQGKMLWLNVEHPLPFLPNFRVERTALNTQGERILSQSLHFGGETFAAGTRISSQFDLDHDDLILYYEVLDNVVSVDIGIDVKAFDGGLTVASNGRRGHARIDGQLPLLYLHAETLLPGNLLLVGQISALDVQDTEIRDQRLAIRASLSDSMGIEFGERRLRVTLDDQDEDLTGNAEFSGRYLALTLSF